MINKETARQIVNPFTQLMNGLGDFFHGSSAKKREKNQQKGLEIEERAKIERIRGIREEDLGLILQWAADSTVRGHLDPAPRVPENWDDPVQIEDAVTELRNYYNNFGEPVKTMPFIGENKFKEAVTVGTLRWRGDPYVPVNARTASIERVIVKPELQGRGIGTMLLATMIEFALVKTQIYRGYPAKEVRVWVMTDKIASPWEKNIDFVRQFGFKPVPGESQWKEYAEKRGLDAAGRDALWYRLNPDWYQKAKKGNSRIMSCETLDMSLFRS